MTTTITKGNIIDILAVSRWSLISLVLLLSSLPTPVRADTFGDFTYTTNDSSATITKYTGPGGSVTIPDNIGGMPVISIGNNAFDSCASLTNVTIPDSVSSIGYGVFAYCKNLPNVTIPSSVTNIGTEAFLFCTGLTNATIGHGVINIGNEAFYGCNRLADTTIPGSVTNIGDYAFDGCSSLTSITIPNSVTRIGDHAFVSCGLTSVTLGNSVTNIGSYAFGWCYSLPRISLPASVTRVGYLAFEQCRSLAAFSVDASNSVFCSVDGVLFDYSGTTLLVYPPAKADRYTISNNVTGIGAGAFHYCASLTNITIPEGVTTIGNDAFYECTRLTSVTIPNSVTNIGDSAFAYSALTNVTFGNGVAKLGNYAFDSCDNLVDIYFRGNAPSVGSGTFFTDDKATIYYLPGTTGWDTTVNGRPTAKWVLPNPVILSFGSNFGIQTNGFGFIISWASNAPVIVEASTNPANPSWFPVTTNTLSEGTAYFSDAEWTNYPSRIYRLRTP